MNHGDTRMDECDVHTLSSAASPSSSAVAVVPSSHSPDQCESVSVSSSSTSFLHSPFIYDPSTPLLTDIMISTMCVDKDKDNDNDDDFNDNENDDENDDADNENNDNDQHATRSYVSSDFYDLCESTRMSGNQLFAKYSCKTLTHKENIAESAAGRGSKGDGERGTHKETIVIPAVTASTNTGATVRKGESPTSQGTTTSASSSSSAASSSTIAAVASSISASSSSTATTAAASTTSYSGAKRTVSQRDLNDVESKQLDERKHKNDSDSPSHDHNHNDHDDDDHHDDDDNKMEQNHPCASMAQESTTPTANVDVNNTSSHNDNDGAHTSSEVTHDTDMNDTDMNDSLPLNEHGHTHSTDAPLTIVLKGETFEGDV